MKRFEKQPSTGARRRVAVVGGGVGGLTAAFRCATAGDDVSVFESGPVFGGSILTLREAGFIVEQGAEAFPANSAAVRTLADDLGIGLEIQEQLVARSFEFDGAGLTPLEPGEAAVRLGLSGRSAVGAGVATFRLGMQQIIDKLVERLAEHAELRTNAPVVSLMPSNGGWRVARPGTANEFDAVIVAGSGQVAAALLTDVFGSAASDLAHSHRIPSITVSLAYSSEAIAHPLDGTGFVTQNSAEVEGCVAGTFTSSKFEGRAPAGMKLVRLFFRPTNDDLVLSSQSLRERALRVMARVFPGVGAPLFVWEARWPEGFPLIDHVQQAKVTNLEEALEGHAVVLAGSAFHGSGIDAAVRSADAAVGKLHASVSASRSKPLAS